MNSIMNSCNPTTTESFLLQKIYRSTYDFSPIKLADDRWWAGVILPTSRLLRRSFFPLIPSSIIHSSIHHRPSLQIVVSSSTHTRVATGLGCSTVRRHVEMRPPSQFISTKWCLTQCLRPYADFPRTASLFTLPTPRNFPRKSCPRYKAAAFDHNDYFCEPLIVRCLEIMPPVFACAHYNVIGILMCTTYWKPNSTYSQR